MKRFIQKDEVRVTLKVGEAAKLAGCGQRAIRNGVDEGSIPHLRFGRNSVIPRAAFLQWLESAAMKSGGQGQV